MALTLTTGNTFAAGDVVTATKLNNTVNSATYTGSLEVAKGGTGSTTAADARTALSVPEASTVMLKANNLSDLANAATARTNLGVSATAATLLVANNLSDVADLATARANLALTSPARCTAQTDNTSSSYADVTGMSVNVTSGTSYTLELLAWIKFWNDGIAGVNLKLTGTATVSSLAGLSYTFSGSGVSPSTAGTSLPVTLGPYSRNGGGSTFENSVVNCTITFTCSGTGTLKLQLAQNSGSTTASVLVGSYIKLFAY